jgi:hypothetical protein
VHPCAGTMAVVGCRTAPAGGPDLLLAGLGFVLPTFAVAVGVAGVRDGTAPRELKVRVSAAKRLNDEIGGLAAAEVLLAGD